MSSLPIVKPFLQAAGAGRELRSAIGQLSGTGAVFISYTCSVRRRREQGRGERIAVAQERSLSRAPMAGRSSSSSIMAGDAFSTEAWDPAAKTFDDKGEAKPHWWSAESAQACSTICRVKRRRLFHGHEHDRVMAYRVGGDRRLQSPSAFLGGFAVVARDGSFMDVAFGRGRGRRWPRRVHAAFSRAFRLKRHSGTRPFDRPPGVF